jgi:Ca2+-binding RTX toxin-like protein
LTVFDRQLLVKGVGVVFNATMTLTRPSLLAAVALIAIAGALAAQPASASAKLRSSVSTNGILTVRGGKGSDRVRVICDTQNLVKVNGKNPRNGATTCSAVSEVDAVTGPGNDRVDLSGVGAGFGQRDLPGFGQGTGAAAQLGSGRDRYSGSATAFNLVLGGLDKDRASGGGLRDDLEGGSGNDNLSGAGGRDVLLGNGGNDKLGGGADDDLLSGNAGNDLLTGGLGADLLGGGRGMDRLLGGDGDDQLIGGPDKDKLDGGPGNNTLAQDSPAKQ